MFGLLEVQKAKDYFLINSLAQPADLPLLDMSLPKFSPLMGLEGIVILRHNLSSLFLRNILSCLNARVKMGLID